MTETQFVLRLPDKLATKLRALMNKRKADPALDSKEKAQPCFEIKPHEPHKDKLVHALPHAVAKSWSYIQYISFNTWCATSNFRFSEWTAMTMQQHWYI